MIGIRVLLAAWMAFAPAGTDDASARKRMVHAILQDQVEVVQTLLAQGVSPNGSSKPGQDDYWAFNGQDDSPPFLVLAARFGSPASRIVKLLLDRGADANRRDRAGRTPLMNAAELGWSESMEMLLAHKPDVNAGDREGVTALMHAMGNRNLSAVALLVRRGARINARDARGVTPLMYAITNAAHDPIMLYGQPDNPREAAARQLELVKFLVDHGADVRARDRNGTTALQLAESHHALELAALLRAAGG